MKKKVYLTYNERYQLNYNRGKRTGRIEVLREVLIRTIKLKIKEDKLKPSKKLFVKINREIDNVLLSEIIDKLIFDKLSVKDIELNYDKLFLIPNDDQNSKNLELCPAIKEKS